MVAPHLAGVAADIVSLNVEEQGRPHQREYGRNEYGGIPINLAVHIASDETSDLLHTCR
jgi:hypothetical protein